MAAQEIEGHTPAEQGVAKTAQGTGCFIVCEIMEPASGLHEAAAAAITKLRTSDGPCLAEQVDTASLTLRPALAFRAEDAEKAAELLKDSLPSPDRRSRTPEAQSVIDEAKAILIARGMSENEAFKALRTTSMNTRKPMDQVARDFLASQEE